MSCPSKKALVELLDYHSGKVRHRYDSATEADKIRALCAAGKPKAALKHFDRIAELHGVEYLRVENERSAHYSVYGGGGVSYVNTGDTYTLTLLLDEAKDRLFVGNWGDVVERDARFRDNSDYRGLAGASTSRKASGGSACRSKTGRFIKCRR